MSVCHVLHVSWCLWLDMLLALALFVAFVVCVYAIMRL